MQGDAGIPPVSQARIFQWDGMGIGYRGWGLRGHVVRLRPRRRSRGRLTRRNGNHSVSEGGGPASQTTSGASRRPCESHPCTI